MSLTVWTVLIAFGCPFWGGPLFLCWVWLLPEKRICPHCDRATPKHESLCRHCGRPVLLTVDEARQVAAQRAPERAELAALGRKYASFEMLSFVPFILVAAGGAVISYLILAAIATWYHQNLEAGVFASLFLRDTFYWLPAAFLGMACAYPVCAVLFRVTLRSYYAEYEAYQRRRSSSDMTRIANLIFSSVALVSIGLAAMLLDTYLIAYPDRLVINRFWGIGESHFAYDQIVALRSTQQVDDTLLEETRYVIRFADGERWSNIYRDDLPGAVTTFMQVVSERTGLPIETVPQMDRADT